MTDVNLEVAISNDEPSVPMVEDKYIVDFSVRGVPLAVSHYGARGTPAEYQKVSQPTSLPEIFVQNTGTIGTNDPLTSSHGPEYSIPLRLKALDSDFEHLFSIDEKVNQYYNDVSIQYLDNGQQKEIMLYAPDDAASLIINNYSPGFYSFNTSTELQQFLSDYTQVIAEPTLEKRMSHYNLEWEEKNQTILDALNNTNGLEMQQILWNVYDFSGGNK